MLGVELECICVYLEILCICMGVCLVVEVQVFNELYSVYLLVMVLQILVENVIKYGLEFKFGGGMIWILVCGFDDYVIVIVVDDGFGFGYGISGIGIGLKNLCECLCLICGEQVGVVIVVNFFSGVVVIMILLQLFKECSYVV